MSKVRVRSPLKREHVCLSGEKGKAHYKSSEMALPEQNSSDVRAVKESDLKSLAEARRFESCSLRL